MAVSCILLEKSILNGATRATKRGDNADIANRNETKEVLSARTDTKGNEKLSPNRIINSTFRLSLVEAENHVRARNCLVAGIDRAVVHEIDAASPCLSNGILR